MNREEKKAAYEEIISSLKAFPKGYLPLITALSEFVNIVKAPFPYMDWVGFYLKDVETDSLYLGPYIGKEACEAIPFSKGVCGKAARDKTTEVISDVSKVSYHIACSSTTHSEIVVPVLKEDGVTLIGVLDIDSDLLNAFDEIDRQYLKAACYLLSKSIKRQKNIA